MGFYRNAAYRPHQETPYRLSRSKIDLFVECPRCFYLDQRLGIKRPSFPAYTLNSAVDVLLKKEFDLLRKKGEAHAAMQQYKIDAVPFAHPELEDWRNPFVGKQYLHRPTNFLVFGTIDDVWIDSEKRLCIVDYKSTSTNGEISLDDPYKQGFKRQMEVYQWIFRQSGFAVNPLGYFVYANAGKNRPSFDGRLEFGLSIIPYRGDSAWVEETLSRIKAVLESAAPPAASKQCAYCGYLRAAGGWL